MEIWKDIKGYEGVYQVSNLGRVKSLDRIIYNSRYGHFFKKGLIMKTPNNFHGYPYLNLHKENTCKTVKVHRLVSEAFLEKRQGKHYVNHIDGVKHNNKVSNLEWCTSSENNYHAFKLGLKKSQQGQKHYKSKLTDKDVLRIRRIFSNPNNTLTKREVALRYGVTDVTISYIVLRRTWRHI